MKAVTLRQILGTSILLAGLGLGACDSSSGGGGAAPAQPQNTNTASASVTDQGGASATIEGTQAQGAKGTFGAAISGTLLNIWITGGDGKLISAVIDTATYNLPGSATMGTPAQAPGFLTLLDPSAGATRSSTGGAIVVEQCPNTMGQAFTGRFDNVALTDEISGATSTLSGSFNLVVLAKAGDLVCKTATTTPPPDTTEEGEFPGQGQSACSNPTCDGPCCPFIPCLSSCTLDCQNNACMDPTDFGGCIQCMNGCVDTCNVDQACMDAAQAVADCSANAGCDELETDEAEDACLAQSCCSELQGAY